ncbi:MAG: RnfABCDGE type electron transport complex subunit G [Candidatus Nitricoxidivorans perseverans]|uniref:Ion-translocating oxidoreductase complex subunit G n=1 Tax=Candidatus Nitricoxidivorans perseverans TaxID=2975601 RepID=A0AA49IZW9_9PROT|nr:MAG: RnfABCDGE type electron transport complex subunit G [Candidatus Nitricoxidivorans perseverans]
MMASPAPSAAHVSSRTAAALLVFTLVFTGLMAATYNATRPLLEASAQAEKMKLVNEVLPPGQYDNDLLVDFAVLPPQPALGLDAESRLYRARKGGEPVALVLEAAAPDGYAGRIALVLAVRADGRLAAVRITGHKETPGLGDYIDPKKDKQGRKRGRLWIAQFNDAALGAGAAGPWKVKKDGGRFDYMTGATISARAVANASGKALAWAVERRERLFALPVGGKYEEGAP